MPKKKPVKVAPKLRENMISEVQRTVLFVDPGLTGTGWAFWDLVPTPAEIKRCEAEVSLPNDYGVIKPNRSAVSWLTRAFDSSDQFAGVLHDHMPNIVVIEGQSVWDSTPAAYASSRSGDIIKLAHLVGMYLQAVQGKYELPIYLLPVPEWKGQLPKPAVHRRIRRALGNQADYPNHAADAVGMGLYIMGAL